VLLAPPGGRTWWCRPCADLLLRAVVVVVAHYRTGTGWRHHGGVTLQRACIDVVLWRLDSVVARNCWVGVTCFCAVLGFSSPDREVKAVGGAAGAPGSSQGVRMMAVVVLATHVPQLGTSVRRWASAVTIAGKGVGTRGTASTPWSLRWLAGRRGVGAATALLCCCGMCWRSRERVKGEVSRSCA
jgi:hypothetical protein